MKVNNHPDDNDVTVCSDDAGTLNTNGGKVGRV